MRQGHLMENLAKNGDIPPTKQVVYQVSSFEDKLLFILVCLRKATTQDVLGELFGMSQPIANKWIHRLLPVLNDALAELGELPSRETILASFDVPADTSFDNQVPEHFFS